MKTTLFSFMLLVASPILAQDGQALITACLMGDIATVKAQVDKGADVNFKNDKNQTPVACSFFWPEITTYLLAKGADVNGGEYPALVNAANYYSIEVIDILLKAGADPNKTGYVKVDLAAGVRKLLDEEKAKGKKANKYMVKAYEDQIKTLPSNGLTFTALGNAVKANCGPCMEMLLKAGAKTAFKNEISGGNLLHEVASSYTSPQLRIDGIKASIPYYEKAGMKTPDWYSDLDLSVFGNLDDNIKFLVKNGVDIEGEDNQKQTPLKATVALIPIREDVVNALITNGANLRNAAIRCRAH